MKIADEVPRDDVSTINTVYFTAELDTLFKENQKIDPTLRFVIMFAVCYNVFIQWLNIPLSKNQSVY